MSAYNPHIFKVVEMVEGIHRKHVGEMDWLTLEWKILELYNPGDWQNSVEQVVPLLNISFK